MYMQHFAQTLFFLPEQTQAIIIFVSCLVFVF